MIVAFDLDGTLVDSAPDIHAIANAAMEAEGLPPLDLPTVRGFVGRGVGHLAQRLAEAQGAAGDPALAARLEAGIVARYEGAVGLSRLYPGVRQAVDALRGAGHVLAICTNKPEAPARALLRHMGLLNHFAVITGGDSGWPRKPDPKPLLETIAACGGGPAVFVGDSEVDAACAAAAQVPLILFSGGYRHTAAEDLPQRAVIHDFAQLPGVLRLLAL